MKHEVGTEVEIIGNSSSHGYKIGKIVIISQVADGKYYAPVNGSNIHGHTYWFREKDCNATNQLKYLPSGKLIKHEKETA